MKKIKTDYIGIAGDLITGLLNDNDLPYYDMIEDAILGLKAVRFATGYTVSIGEEKTVPLYLDTLHEEMDTALAIACAIEEQHDYLLNLSKKIDTRAIGLSLGFWVNNGLLYIDVNTVLHDKNIAVAMGLTNRQLAIWDNLNKKEIML